MQDKRESECRRRKDLISHKGTNFMDERVFESEKAKSPLKRPLEGEFTSIGKKREFQ